MNENSLTTNPPEWAFGRENYRSGRGQQTVANFQQPVCYHMCMRGAKANGGHRWDQGLLRKDAMTIGSNGGKSERFGVFLTDVRLGSLRNGARGAGNVLTLQTERFGLGRDRG